MKNHTTYKFLLFLLIIINKKGLDLNPILQNDQNNSLVEIKPFNYETDFLLLKELFLENKKYYFKGANQSELECKIDLYYKKQWSKKEEPNSPPVLTYVAHYNNNFAGFISFYKKKIIDNDQTYEIGYILLLCVSKNFRKKGIGEQLIKNAINKLATMINFPKIIIHTDYYNKPALRLYEKLGFGIEKYDSNNSLFFDYKGCSLAKTLNDLY